MSEQPSGDATHAEQGELDALRRRAYGPDADILDDPDAVARLSELEERLRRARAVRVPGELRSDAYVDDATADPSTGSTTPAAPRAAVLQEPPAARRTASWHSTLVAGTAVVAVLLGVTAWNASEAAGPDQPASRFAKTAAVAMERRAASYEVGYKMYLDGLRDDLLSRPGMQQIASRVIRDQLRPYGTLYGRPVGAGPTLDHQFCMIIADVPEPSITCISIENAYANPVSVVLPAWYSDSESDLFTGLGEPVTYTLMPGGSVVAERATTAASAAQAAPADSAPPVATAAPPPGQE